MSEWLKEPVSKTGVPFMGAAGSNPALSDLFKLHDTYRIRNKTYEILVWRLLFGAGSFGTI